jgi:hypothetical protein
MSASIINKPNVKSSVLDELAKGLPAIIAEVMQVPGGNMALLKPRQKKNGARNNSAAPVLLDKM